MLRDVLKCLSKIPVYPKSVYIDTEVTDLSKTGLITNRKVLNMC